MSNVNLMAAAEAAKTRLALVQGIVCCIRKARVPHDPLLVAYIDTLRDSWDRDRAAITEASPIVRGLIPDYRNSFFREGEISAPSAIIAALVAERILLREIRFGLLSEEVYRRNPEAFQRFHADFESLDMAFVFQHIDVLQRHFEAFSWPRWDKITEKIVLDVEDCQRAEREHSVGGKNPQDETDEINYISASEAASLTGISLSQLNRLTKKGTIKHRKPFSNKLEIHLPSLLRYLKNRENGSF